MASAYKYVGGSGVSLGPGDFPLSFPPLPAIPGVQINDLIVVAYFLDAVYTPDGYSLLFPNPGATDSLGNLYGAVWEGGEAFGTVSERIQNLVANVPIRDELDLFFGSKFAGAPIVQVSEIVLLPPGPGGSYPDNYTAAHVSVAVYRKLAADPNNPPGPLGTAWAASLTPWAPTPFPPFHAGYGSANVYDGALDAIADVAPQAISSGFDPLYATELYLGIGFISPGSGAPSAGWTVRPGGIIADAANQRTISVAGATGILFLTANHLIAEVSISCPGVNGIVGSTYSTPVPVTGGIPPYMVTVVSGSLPPGLKLVDGVIVGIPTMRGTFTMIFAVTDATLAVATTGECSIVIAPNVPPCP